MAADPNTDPALHLHPSQPIHIKVSDTLVGLVVGAILGPFVHELVGRHSERLARQMRSSREHNPRPRRRR
jgi:hypothetical protein